MDELIAENFTFPVLHKNPNPLIASVAHPIWVSAALAETASNTSFLVHFLPNRLSKA